MNYTQLLLKASVPVFPAPTSFSPLDTRAYLPHSEAFHREHHVGVVGQIGQVFLVHQAVVNRVHACQVRRPFPHLLGVVMCIVIGGIY